MQSAGTQVPDPGHCERDVAGNPARALRGLVRRATAAELSEPVQQAVDVAADLDGMPLVLAPAGIGDAQAGLLYSDGPERATVDESRCQALVSGTLLAMAEEPGLGRYICRFCNRHRRRPEELQDRGLELYRLRPESARLHTDGTERLFNRDQYLLRLDEIPDHQLMEWDNLAHQNYQHLDINELLVTGLLRQPAGRWILCGLDPEGMDFFLDGRHCRLPFPDTALTYREMGRCIKGWVARLRDAGDELQRGRDD